MILSTHTMFAGHALVRAGTNRQSGQGFFGTLALFFTATLEGIRQARQYQELTERGMAPEEAARKVVFGTGKR